MSLSPLSILEQMMAEVHTRQVFRSSNLEPLEMSKRSVGDTALLVLMQGENVIAIDEDDFEEFVETLTECAGSDPEPDDEFGDDEDFDDDIEAASEAEDAEG
jgi:hypothetical protein